MSSRTGDYLGRILQNGEDLASNIAFETTDDFGLAHSLAGATEHVCLGPAIMTKPDHNDAIESCIGLAVATAVQPMSVGLARGSRYRVHPAQRGEGGLGVEVFRVTPSSDQECRGGVGSYAEDTDQGWRCRQGEPFQLGLQVVDLLAELIVVASQRAKSILGRRRGIVQATDTEALAPRGEGAVYNCR